MTSSGHVTSSVTCAIDSPWPNSYKLSIGTIPLSGFVSEIFSAEVATKLDLVQPAVGPFDPPSPKTLP